MDTKLTLSLKKRAIDNAKRYAQKHHTSVSQLVEDYFEYLATRERQEFEEFGELTKRLMAGPAFGGNKSDKELIMDALAEKYS